MQVGVRIDYKVLRRIKPEAARRAVLEYLSSCNHNVAQTARAFGVTRATVYAIRDKAREGDLADRPKRPHRQPLRHHLRWRSE